MTSFEFMIAALAFLFGTIAGMALSLSIYHMVRSETRHSGDRTP